MGDLSYQLCCNKVCVISWIADHEVSSFQGSFLSRFLIIRSNWGIAASILLETGGILTAPLFSLELFPETRPINLLDFLLPNQPSLTRGHCHTNTFTLNTWDRSAGWPTLPGGLLHTLLKTLPTVSLAAAVCSDSAHLIIVSCLKEKPLIGPLWLPVLSEPPWLPNAFCFVTSTSVGPVVCLEGRIALGLFPR